MKTRDTFRPSRSLALAALAAATLVPSASPAVERGSRVLVEPSVGLVVPAAGWAVGDTSETSATTYDAILGPAFVGALRFGYLFQLGSGGACCLVGPEIGWAYVAWDAKDPERTGDPYYFDGDDLTGLRMQVLAAARLMAVWDWGWVLARLGAGPEMSDASWGSFDEFEGDVGAFLTAGSGIGLSASEHVGFTLLFSMLASFHEQASDEWGNESIWWGYRSLEFDISLGLTILI